MNVLNAASPENDSLDPDLMVVDTKQISGLVDLRELWRYRDLVWILAARDITVRYRQTFVGIAWTILQPLGLMFALGLFKKMVVIESVKGDTPGGRIPDEVKVLCGLILYQLFAGIITASTQCLVDNRQMLTKVYFPRMVLPLAASMRPLIDFFIGMILLALLMFWNRIPPSYALVLAPFALLSTYLAGLSFGVWLSALNAHYRDFGHLVPFALQLGLIVSPIAIDSQAVPERWRWLYFANPMAANLDVFRWAVLGTPLPGWKEIVVCVLTTTFLLVSGAWYFRRVDRFLADNI